MNYAINGHISHVPASAKHLWTLVGWEAPKSGARGTITLGPGTPVEFGQEVQTTYVRVGGAKVTTLHDVFDLNGDGSPDLERERRDDGKTFLRRRPWSPDAFVAADHDGNGLIDSVAK